MKQYNVTGMSCAACSARVEKAVSNVPGVTACSVSLLTNSMGVEGTAADQAIIDAVQAAGYGASVKGAQQSAGPAAGADALADHETPKLRRRLFWSLGFLLVLMYFSMGHMMWGWPLPKFYDGNHVAMGLTQLLLTVIIMVINQKFFISGFQALWHRAPNMDTLVALGATAAFVYSTYALFAMTRRAGARRRAGRHELHDGLLLRVRRHDPHAHHRGQDARGPLEGQDDRRAAQPHGARAEDRHRRARRRGSDRPGRAGAAGRCLRRPTRRAHPGGRRLCSPARAQSTRRRSPARASRPTRRRARPSRPRR